jgi:hypothetical protein
MEHRNIAHDIENLARAFYALTDQLASPYLPPLQRDRTFREENWIVVFPFNFSERSEIISTLALLNSLYVTFFLREDDVLDEYHVPPGEFRLYTLRHCEAQQFRGYAVQELIHRCGNAIMPYLARYEQMYYHALIWEKTLCANDISLEAIGNPEHCEQLGRKIMPLCLSFAAYSILTGTEERIGNCEELLVRYHAAHQLFDDMSDLLRDAAKPDKSYLLRALEHHGIEGASLTADNARKILIETGIAAQVITVSDRCLRVAREKAEVLNFTLMLQQIQRLERKVEAGRTLLPDNP